MRQKSTDEQAMNTLKLLGTLRTDWDTMKLAERGRIIHQLIDAGVPQSTIVDHTGRDHAAIWRSKHATGGHKYWKGPNSKHTRQESGDGRKLAAKCSSKKVDAPVFGPPAEAKNVKTPRESWSCRGDKAEYTTYSDEPIITLEDLKRVCKIDESEWEVERYVCNAFGVTMKPSATTEWVEGKKGHEYPAFTLYDAEPVYRTNYQVKAWLKRKTLVIAARDEVRQIIEDAKQFAPVYIPFARRSERSGNMLEVGFPDLHLAKYAWAPETGHADYDIQLATQVHDRALDAIVARSGGHRLDQIVYVVGNDFFNSDNRSNLTTKGTPQSTDTRYLKMIRTGRQMTVRAIDRLTQLAPVRVVVIPGNHDEHTSLHLGEELAIWYRNCPDVQVDNSPTLRKYYQFGQVMLMWTHGDKEKKEDLNGIMAAEQPKMWGNTMFREAHVGHLHKTMMNEKFGMRWRILSALCPADSWHAENGYIGNLRGAEAFVWNQDNGLIGTAVYTEQEANGYSLLSAA
jgi:hypothetical protein